MQIEYGDGGPIMLAEKRGAIAVGALLAMSVVAGCAPERAVVGFSYVVEPTRGLPPGMKTITIQPATLGPTTDPKWSDMCSTVLNSLVDESRNSFGTDIRVSNRRDAGKVFEEDDLKAAGMSTEQGAVRHIALECGWARIQVRRNGHPHQGSRNRNA